MTFYTHMVIEHYPDGGKWSHPAMDLADARDIAVELKEAHPSRKYEIREASRPYPHPAGESRSRNTGTVGAE